MADERDQLTPETLDAMRAFIDRTSEAREPFSASLAASQAMAESAGEPHPYSLRMSRQDRARLEALAKRMGVKSSALARRILVEGLARYEALSDSPAASRGSSDAGLLEFQHKLERELAELKNSQNAILQMLGTGRPRSKPPSGNRGPGAKKTTTR